MFAHTGEFPSHGSTGTALRPWFATLLKAATATLVIALGNYAWTAAGAAASRPDPKSRVMASAGPGVLASLDRRPSHNGRYQAEVLAAGSIGVGVVQSWTIHVAGRGQRRVAHAKVTVKAWMPEMEERSPMRARAQYVGNGDYRVDRLCFSRPGWWNVALVIDGRAGVDSVAFNVVLPRAASPGAQPGCGA